MRRWALILLTTGLALVSCDDEAAPSVEATWANYCTREVQRQMACGEVPRPESCAESGVCMGNIAVPEYVGPLTECLVKRPCDKSDDDCYEQAAQRGAGRPTSQATIRACTAKYADCQDQERAFICNLLGLSQDAFLREVDGCLGGSCAGLQSCMQGLFASKGC